MSMQTFHSRLFSGQENAWAALARLTRASRQQLAALDLDWIWWE